jgi:hypothetical protein
MGAHSKAGGIVVGGSSLHQAKAAKTTPYGVDRTGSGRGKGSAWHVASRIIWIIWPVVWLWQSGLWRPSLSDETILRRDPPRRYEMWQGEPAAYAHWERGIGEWPS